MFQKISALAAKVERFVNNAAYVFEVVQWLITSLRQVAAILNSFPKPAGHDAEKESDLPQSDSERSTGSEEQQSGQSENKPQPVEGKDIII